MNAEGRQGDGVPGGGRQGDGVPGGGRQGDGVPEGGADRSTPAGGPPADGPPAGDPPAGGAPAGGAERRRRGGRRRGGGTRETILEAARACFADLGYDRATVRRIASTAHVDPALIIHYFGSKEALFMAALQLPIRPGDFFLDMSGVDRDQMGGAIVRRFLSVWELPETRVTLVAMLRSALINDRAWEMIRDILSRQVFGPLTHVLGVPDARLRANLVGSQFFGLAMMRYVAEIEPIASASVEDIVAAVGPTIQRYIMGDIGDGERAGDSGRE